MRVFVDCEFTDFIDCDLISIGIVAEDGREFYGERSDYDGRVCSVFVREAVLPQLGRYPGRVFAREGLRDELRTWLDQFDGERVVCVDFATDWGLLLDLLDGEAGGWQAQLVSVDQGKLETYFAQHPGRHHALVDARAQRYALLGTSMDTSDAGR